jgi:hypothetical protein
MDIQNLKNLADAAFDHALYRKTLYERTQAELTLVYNNGMFAVTSELITFLSIWPKDEIYLKDVHNNPIQCNRNELLKLSIEKYEYVMNTWHNEFEQSKKLRKLSNV